MEKCRRKDFRVNTGTKLKPLFFETGDVTLPYLDQTIFFVLFLFFYLLGQGLAITKAMILYTWKTNSTSKDVSFEVYNKTLWRHESCNEVYDCRIEANLDFWISPIVKKSAKIEYELKQSS